jgi:hypothetical protein
MSLKIHKITVVNVTQYGYDGGGQPGPVSIPSPRNLTECIGGRSSNSRISQGISCPFSIIRVRAPFDGSIRHSFEPQVQ